MLNLGNYGSLVSTVKPTCEVYQGDAVAETPKFTDFQRFPYCDLSKYDSDQGLYINIDGAIAANSSITVRLKGLRVDSSVLTDFNI